MKWAKKLTARRQKEYKYSRGYARLALSKLFDVDPLQIPLHAEPGKPPKLAEGWGHMSLSHCSDALIIGWSRKKLGVDLEKSNRTFNAQKLVNRFFSKSEQEILKISNEQDLSQNVLSRWVIKEAAIKWQEGSIYEDLKQWDLAENYQWAYHKSRQCKINTRILYYKNWIIGIAYNRNHYLNSPILCIN